MYIKQLIKDEADYWNLVWPFVDWTQNPNKSLWHDEDLPKLKPFFDNQQKKDWTPEIIESFDFYKKCHKEYGKKNTEIRDAVSQYTPDAILEAFGYTLPQYDDDDYEYKKNEPLQLEKDFDATFPFIIVGDIYCTYDRLGRIRFMSLYRISLADFTAVPNIP